MRKIRRSLYRSLYSVKSIHMHSMIPAARMEETDRKELMSGVEHVVKMKYAAKNTDSVRRMLNCLFMAIMAPAVAASSIKFMPQDSSGIMPDHPEGVYEGRALHVSHAEMAAMIAPTPRERMKLVKRVSLRVIYGTVRWL